MDISQSKYIYYGKNLKGNFYGDVRFTNSFLNLIKLHL